MGRAAGVMAAAVAVGGIVAAIFVWLVLGISVRVNGRVVYIEPANGAVFHAMPREVDAQRAADDQALTELARRVALAMAAQKQGLKTKEGVR